MGYWESRPNIYKEHNFIEIPEGSHRVLITNVEVERFPTSKKRCYEITLKVSGQHGRLWFYLWYDPNDMTKTEKVFSSFYNSFHIQSQSTRSYRKWIGKMGAVYVEHNYGPSQRLQEGEYEAKVSCCLDVRLQAKLPPWRDAPVEKEETPQVFSQELPFL